MEKEMGMTVYDEVPYESRPYRETHPEQMMTVASLFGLSIPNIRQFSYLEIGCASGGNLIPMAIQYPTCEFVGLDYAPSQVVIGEKMIQDLGLTNIRLISKNILDVTQDFGQFDFIAAHGIYSWVPDEVRDKLVGICSENLKPEGLAYLSYNTYPGWKLREIVRDMMMFPTRNQSSLKERAEQAVAFLRAIEPAFKDGKTLYAAMLYGEIAMAINATPELINHDYLEKVNNPVYFHEFMSHISGYGLTHVGDLAFSAMSKFLCPNSETTDRLTQDSSAFLDIEQHGDYLASRYFRRSLITHKNREINRLVNKGSVVKLRYSLSKRPKPEDAPPAVPEDLSAAVFQAIYEVLAAQWPRSLLFTQLLKTVKEKCKRKYPNADFEPVVIDALLFGLTSAKFCVHMSEINVANKVSEKPLASALARYQAITQTWVTSQHHDTRVLDEFSMHLIKLLDGTRNKKDICLEIEKLVKDGVLPLLDENNRFVTDQAVITQKVRQTVDSALKLFVDHALLIG